MKKLLYTLLALTTLVLPACNSTPENNDGTESTDNIVDNYTLEKEEPTEIPYGSVEAQWIIYDSVQELLDSELATTVFIGTVTDISFQVLDPTTGFPPTEKSEYYEQYTMYDVDIITSYKGLSVKQVRMEGGLLDYRVEDQLELIKEYNIEYMLIWENNIQFEIGETYLFVLYQYIEDVAPTPVNLTQAVYNIRNPFEKSRAGNWELDNPEEYYSRSKDDYGSALISAKDIISHFGDDKWDEFWTQWQKDNPDWETRIDKAAVEQALAE